MAPFRNIKLTLSCCAVLLLQLKDLAATIAAVPCDIVLLGTPHDLTSLLTLPHPVISVTYEVTDLPADAMAGVTAAAAAADGGVTVGSAVALEEQLVEFMQQH